MEQCLNTETKEHMCVSGPDNNSVKVFDWKTAEEVASIDDNEGEI